MTRRKAVTAPAPEPKKRRTKKVEPFVLREGHALVLRTCASDLTSYNGFQWPESGAVEAPDWKSRAECGNGLHGLLWGIGDGSLLSWDADARWLVVDVLAADVVEIGAKVKFPRCEVVYCGARDEAVAMLIAHGADPSKVVYGTATAGDCGTATAGNYGTATAGNYGTATAGDSGTATAGARGTATAGARGTATAGYFGTATAGDYGTLILRSWDDKNQRRRFHVGYIGEDGLEPNVAYRLDEQGRFVRADGGAK
jgi:hypothetical protein